MVNVFYKIYYMCEKKFHFNLIKPNELMDLPIFFVVTQNEELIPNCRCFKGSHSLKHILPLNKIRLSSIH